MLISIAICTWNRSKSLRKTLEQMTNIIIPSEVQLEVLIVNNNSTDETDSVITAFSDRLPICRLFEPRQGQSNARNRALSHARGEYIMWTDDDVLVDERWLIEYWNAFKDHPEAVLFGGSIEPWFDRTPPLWLCQVLPQVSDAYAVRDLSTQSAYLKIQKGFFPYGANFVVRTKEQLQHLYDPCLGLKPNSSIRGDESAIIKAMIERGFKGWWIPTARVRHYIPEERQTIRYLRSFYFGLGESAALQTPASEKSSLLGRPRWMWRAAIEVEMRYRVRRVLSDPSVWIEDLKQASYWWGNLCMYALCPHQR